MEVNPRSGEPENLEEARTLESALAAASRLNELTGRGVSAEEEYEPSSRVYFLGPD